MIFVDLHIVFADDYFISFCQIHERSLGLDEDVRQCSSENPTSKLALIIHCLTPYRQCKPYC